MLHEWMNENDYNSYLDSKRQSSVLDEFDEAFAEYKQMKINRNKIETERYFDNLAALLR